MSVRRILENNFPYNPTVSNEGIGYLVSRVIKVLTNHKPGEIVGKTEKYSSDERKAFKELETAINKYYLNIGWLTKQTLVTGNIRAADFSSGLNIDGKVGSNPFDNIDVAIKRCNDFTKRHAVLVTSYGDKIKAIDTKLQSDVSKLNGDVELIKKRINQATAEVKALPDPLQKLPKFQGTSLGNIVPVTSNHRVLALEVASKATPVDELPALNIDQIQQAARLMLKAISGNIIDNLNPTLGVSHDDTTLFDGPVGESDEYYDYYVRVYHRQLHQVFTLAAYRLIPPQNLIRMLEKWIDRSIK